MRAPDSLRHSPADAASQQFAPVRLGLLRKAVNTKVALEASGLGRTLCAFVLYYQKL